jgi:flagellar basal-body rod protein FlgB
VSTKLGAIQVDVQVEQAKYAENSIRFQAAFTRLNGAFKRLMMALKGE